jgi:hypothetical protein
MRAVVVLALVASLAGCKKRPDYDRQTPEAALASFFGALESGRFPRHLEHFIIDPDELAMWNHRCEVRGCQGGEYRIVERGETSAHRAVIYLDYHVEGHGDTWVMRGERSPIHFLREGDAWYFTQFGERLRGGPRDPAARPPAEAPAGDDDAPTDEDPAADDAPTADAPADAALP